MKTLKKIIFVLIAVSLLIGCVPPAFAEDYTSGDWTYNLKGGVLTVTGYTGSATEVEIPEKIDGRSVTVIAARAFSKTSIRELTIPKSVKTMNKDILQGYKNTSCLYGMDRLETLIFADGTNVIPAGAAKNTPITTVVIPDSVNTIGADAFWGCASLNSISDMSKVDMIENGAFYGCEALETIDHLDSLETIGKDAFNGAGLTSVELPDTVDTIGARAFANTHLKEIRLPEALTEIGEQAFSKTSIRELTIPKSVKIMNKDILQGYNNTSCLYGMDRLETLIFADGTNVIPAGAAKNTLITTVVIPDSVNTIGADAFSSCSSLNSISDMSNVAKIENGAFYGCEALETIDHLDSLETIGKDAFNGAGLTSVELPDTVDTIGAKAFANTHLEEIRLPETLTEIGEQAFSKTSISV